MTGIFRCSAPPLPTDMATDIDHADQVACQGETSILKSSES
jgi:hypothetical protein